MEVSDKCIHRAMGYAVLLIGKNSSTNLLALAVTAIPVSNTLGVGGATGYVAQGVIAAFDCPVQPISRGT